jgi:hypothetical protein
MDTLYEKIRNLESDIQFKDVEIRHLADRIKEIDSTLVESGILEHEWKPEAPKGSVIKPNAPYYREPSYTKINKVWE